MQIVSFSYMEEEKMTWLYLLLAGIFEVVWATTMKLSEGFSSIKFSVMTVLGMFASFIFLALALKKLPLGLAYPLWTGIGAVGTIIVGVLLFKDEIPALTWVFVGFLIIGILGIKMTSGH